MLKRSTLMSFHSSDFKVSTAFISSSQNSWTPSRSSFDFNSASRSATSLHSSKFEVIGRNNCSGSGPPMLCQRWPLE